MLCPDCGAIIRKNETNCSKCGALLDYERPGGAQAPPRDPADVGGAEWWQKPVPPRQPPVPPVQQQAPPPPAQQGPPTWQQQAPPPQQNAPSAYQGTIPQQAAPVLETRSGDTSLSPMAPAVPPTAQQRQQTQLQNKLPVILGALALLFSLKGFFPAIPLAIAGLVVGQQELKAGRITGNAPMLLNLAAIAVAILSGFGRGILSFLMAL